MNRIWVDWLTFIAAMTCLAAMVTALVLSDASRASWSVAVPVVGWLLSSAALYVLVVRDREGRQ